MPNIRRPSESTSTVASSLARTSGLRNGSTITPLPSRTELVLPARNASVATGSRIGSAGSIGDGGCCGSARTGCSETQTDSTPKPSANSATDFSAARVVYGPELAEHTPIFMVVPGALGATPSPSDAPAPAARSPVHPRIDGPQSRPAPHDLLLAARRATVTALR